MNYFRLTWGVGHDATQTIHDCDNRYEVIGGREAIFDLWFHLSQLKALAHQGLHASACPRFLSIFDKDDISQAPRQGLHALVNCGTFQ